MHKNDLCSLSEHLNRAVEAHNSWKQHKFLADSTDKTITPPVKPLSLCEIQLDINLKEAADIAKRMLAKATQGG